MIRILSALLCGFTVWVIVRLARDELMWSDAATRLISGLLAFSLGACALAEAWTVIVGPSP